MADWQHHGGDCCGIRHINGFFCRVKTITLMRNASEEEKKNLLADEKKWLKINICEKISDALHDNARDDDEMYPGGLLFEVALTLTQHPIIHDAVIEVGFKEVNRFVNCNTGNTIVVYHFFVDND
ncbi:hypothetical protein KGP36_03105 [Patescibacteria group bacterium]|nr:hypothetical protein [Patescibacteria group bacterium]